MFQMIFASKLNNWERIALPASPPPVRMINSTTSNEHQETKFTKYCSGFKSHITVTNFRNATFIF